MSTYGEDFIYRTRQQRYQQRPMSVCSNEASRMSVNDDYKDDYIPRTRRQRYQNSIAFTETEIAFFMTINLRPVSLDTILRCICRFAILLG